MASFSEEHVEFWKDTGPRVQRDLILNFSIDQLFEYVSPLSFNFFICIVVRIHPNYGYD